MKKVFAFFLVLGVLFLFLHLTTPTVFAQDCEVSGYWGSCNVSEYCPVDYETEIYANRGICACRCAPLPTFIPANYSIPNPCDPPNELHPKHTWTALGCLPNDPKELVVWVLGRAIGIGGGIAFLLMLFGGFQVLTSAGDPERLNSGKDVIGSALAGLLLIIFSLFILKLIGVDILGLENVGFKFPGV